MASLTEKFFRDLEKRGYDTRVRSISGTVKWDIEGEEKWYVAVTKGNLKTTQEETKADCVCKLSREHFEGIITGKHNPFTLLLQMQLACEGNMGLLQIFQRLFPDDKFCQKGKETS